MPDPQPSTPRNDRRHERAKQRRVILDAATALFAAHGYHAASMQAIAARAGVSVGYLYKHFAGKEEIFQAILTSHLDRIDELSAEVQQQGLAPLDELRAALAVIARHFDANRDFMRIYHDNLDAVLEHSRDKRAGHHRLLLSVLQRAHAAGEVRDADFELVASAVLGASRELFLALAHRPGDHPFAELPDLLFSLLIDPLRR